MTRSGTPSTGLSRPTSCTVPSRWDPRWSPDPRGSTPPPCTPISGTCAPRVSSACRSRWASRTGVETLRFVEGADGGEGWYHQHTDQGLASAARLLRRIHDAGSGWTPPADAVWGAAALTGEGNVYCHGDPGPWNFIWRDNEAVALIDWDYLHPAPRLDDVAYALRWFAPLRSDEHALEWHHFPEVPDRAARVRTFIEAYGDLPAFDVVDAVTERIRAVVALMCDLAERGVEPQRTWVADGAAERDLEEIAWIEEHRDELATSRD